MFLADSILKGIIVVVFSKLDLLILHIKLEERFALGLRQEAKKDWIILLSDISASNL